MLINVAMPLRNKQTRGVAHFLLRTISGYSKYSTCNIQYAKKPAKHAMNYPCPSHTQQHYCTNINTISCRTTLYVCSWTQHFNATIYMYLPRVLQSLYRDQPRGRHYHIYSSVLRGYEMCMEVAGHERLMNISHKNPKFGGQIFYDTPVFGQHLTRLIAVNILVHCSVVTDCTLHVVTSCTVRFRDCTVFDRPSITDFSCFSFHCYSSEIFFRC